jgi:hypothetical protein
MFCNVCGTQFVPGAAFCSKCGNNLQVQQQMQQQGMPPQGYVQPGPPPSYMSGPPMMQPMVDMSGHAQPRRTSGMAIAGFVLSFLGVLSILGLIFACIGLAECNRSNGAVGGKGLAIAGIAISCVWLLILAGIASGGIRMSHLF